MLQNLSPALLPRALYQPQVHLVFYDKQKVQLSFIILQ